ncbi:zinc transporter 8 [Pelobates cultripes]|uniref:Proton-coupled zinc antiporter SLC30A8 n=1 Tax=Pelobates cultripes TaxID=61616 RepID=A0AAD1W2C9_PELCU|nr:zinc transporter 8 [Pelobates cultripes]
MTGLEKTFLVTDKVTKMYSLTIDSGGQNNFCKEKLQEEEEIPCAITLYHCHNNNSKAHEARQKEQKLAKKKLCIASVICLIFIFAEIAGGYIAGSLAVVTDAAHLLVDLSSFLISLCSLWLSSKPATRRLTFGWFRAEMVGALMSMITIWVVTGVLLYLASERILHPDYKIDGTVMLITSVCALVANLILALILHQKGHGHSHAGGQHEHMVSENEPQTNASIRAAFIHVIGDLFQSISVLTSALIIYFKPQYKIADSICTFIFSIFVLATTFTVLRDVLIVLMEGTPRGINYSAVKQNILAVDGVKSVHSLHLWALTMNQIILSVHVATENLNDSKRILKEVTQSVFDSFPFHSVTIQIESVDEQVPDCMFCYEPTG